MLQRPPRSTRTDTLFPYTTLISGVSMSAILIFSPSSQKVSPSTTQVRRVIPQSSKRGEEVSATSENFGVSSDEVNEVEPNVGQFSASIPPANTIERSEEHTSELQ